jgi:hypothetical protein
MPSRREKAALGAGLRWLAWMVLLCGCMPLRDPAVTAKSKLAGFEICSGYSDALALVAETKGRRYGFIGRDGAVAIQPRFADAQTFSEGLAAVREGSWDRYGYIDTQGRWSIPAAYEAAFPFSEGLAVVTLQGKQGFVDKSGAMRIPARFDRAGAFSEGLAKVVVEGLAGFVNREGAVVMAPIYFKAGAFHAGLAAACTRHKCGYIDREGRVAMAFDYDDAGDFEGGFAPVKVGRLWGYIDKHGRWLVEPAFDAAHPFRDGVALVGKKVTSQPDRGYGGYTGPTTVYGYLDQRGGFLIEPSILRASSFREGLAVIQVPEGGFCSDCYVTTYVRKDGGTLRRFRFGGDFQGGVAVVTAEGSAGAAGFLVDREGHALVEFDRARFDDPTRWAALAPRAVYGYIDRKGATVVPHNLPHAEPFSEGLALVEMRDGKRFRRQRYLDRGGAVKLEVPAGASHAQSFSSGLALLTFSRQGARRYSYMDTTGAIRIEGDYAGAQPFHEGLAAVKTTREHGVNNWGYLNTRGEFAIPPRFNSAGPFLKGIAMVSMIKENILTGGAIDRSGKFVAEAFYPEQGPRDVWEAMRASSRMDEPRDLIPLTTREGFAYAGRDGRIAIRNARYGKGEPFSEGLAAVMLSGRQGAGPWGYIDREGKLVIEAKFTEARPFSEKMAMVRDETGRSGYINHEGAWVIAPSFFEEAHDFRDGRALVRVNEFYGYIDPKGEFAVRPKYAKGTSFNEGLASTGVAR